MKMTTTMKNDNVKTTNENDNDNKDREREEGKHNLKIITIMGGGPSNLTTRGGSPSQCWVLTDVSTPSPSSGNRPQGDDPSGRVV